VQVLTANYIFAKVPANQTGGTVPVRVTNARGKSAMNAFSKVTYAQSPMPCQASLGTGITTGLLS
jgi:hypothetical protein